MHKVFQLSILLKGLTGVLETIVGVLAFIVSKDSLVQLVNMLTYQELLDDPGEQFANFLVTLANNYTLDIQLFVGIYLLIHGITKILLIYGLFKKLLWAYPTAIVIFTLFLTYQIYEYIHQPHIVTLVISVVDVFIIILTYLEYRNLKSYAYH